MKADIDMGMCAHVAAVNFAAVELASLAFASHTTLPPTKWSHSPGETNACHLQRGCISLARTSIFFHLNHTVATKGCLPAGLPHATFTEAV